MTTLADLRPGQGGRVAAIDAAGPLADGLGEAGFTRGADVAVLRRGPVGGTPLSVRVGRAVIALRKEEAAAVRLGDGPVDAADGA